MNLRQPNASTATDTFNRSRNVVPMSGLCVECLDGCKGGCELWLASFRGREVIYPGPFGQITAGADKKQMNVEDTRFGVAEYVLNKHDLDTIE